MRRPLEPAQSTAIRFTQRLADAGIQPSMGSVGDSLDTALADRFLAERAVSVVADRTLEERRWSTPQLLAVEQQLVTSATGR
ncbi:MAG TPA: hypothetical protein VFD04_02965, partial [Actinomycetes bacterium]|nr:hypothetical protein [Actinomycetes bacterium]